MFFSVQLGETGKAISVRQESSRTDLERKYYPGLLEIEVPQCRAHEMKMVHIDMLLLGNRANDRWYKAKTARLNPTRPASQLRPGKTWLGTVPCWERLISGWSMIVAEAGWRPHPYQWTTSSQPSIYLRDKSRDVLPSNTPWKETLICSWERESSLTHSFTWNTVFPSQNLASRVKTVLNGII